MHNMDGYMHNVCKTQADKTMLYIIIGGVGGRHKTGPRLSGPQEEGVGVIGLPRKKNSNFGRIHLICNGLHTIGDER